MITLANYDKYDPKAGGFRAALEADWLQGDLKRVVGVGLNASGNVVKGGGNTGLVGVLVLTEKLKAGDVVDVMTAGEIVDVGGTAGSVYYAEPTAGVVSTTSAAGATKVGHTVKADRLVVRFGGVVAGA